MEVVEPEPEQLGKLVALEGDSETIDIQLRLLPPSQKILVLPHLLDVLSLDSGEHAFNARKFVHDVHTAFTERNETARAFLQSSSSTHQRLCFLNGGSPSARAVCLEKICENVTNGDILQAEAIFNEIVKDGVAGLTKKVATVAEEKAKVDEADGGGGRGQEPAEDPISIAMKAADSLDRETPGLQPETPVRGNVPELEDTVKSPGTGAAHRVFAGSVLRKSALLTDGNEFSKKAIFPSQKCDEIVKTVLTVSSRSRRTTIEKKQTTFGTHYSICTPTTASPMGQAQRSEGIGNDDGHDDLEIISPGNESLISIPPTPAVVYEEAYLVDMQAPTKSLKRAKSFDRFYPSNSRYMEPLLGGRKTLKHRASDRHLRRFHVAGSPEDRYENYQTLPRTTFVKASETTIRRSQTSSTSTRSGSSSSQVPIRVYIDRGEDAFQISAVASTETFAPAFPIVEDLIIHLIDDNPNEVLDSVIRLYKDGSYPITPTSTTFSSQNSEPEASASPAALSSKRQEKYVRPDSYHTAETGDTDYERRHDYNPYNDNYPFDVKRQWPPMQRTLVIDSVISSVGPPAPPPKANGVAEKFLNFTVNSKNAINIQDSLRQLLGREFPAGESDHSQHYFPIAPEAGRLWKPVFRNDQNTSVGNDGRTFDQIIALGCEDGVKKDFFTQISGQIEKLGTKRDGVNRSGKLDIRYLISNAMQYFSVPSISSKSSFNLLSNPQVLAALLVPQIEAYMAINTSTRLLILYYPESHRSTVFALQKLLGSDALKIAGVRDNLATDVPCMSHPRTPNTFSNEAISQRAQTRSPANPLHRTHSTADSLIHFQHQKSFTGSTSSSRANKASSSYSFTKADFLLPCTATDAEITTFISSIWKCLMEKSAFYTLEPEPKPIIVGRPPVPPKPKASSRDVRRERERERERDRHRENDRGTEKEPTYRSSHPKQTGSQSKISRLTDGATNAPSCPPSNCNPSAITTSTARPSTRHRDRDRNHDRDSSCARSIASTRHRWASSIASTKTTKSKKQRSKLSENFYTGDEDSEDDAYDRMIMGRDGGRIIPEPQVKGGPRKRNTKKALKWLGLA